MADSAVSQHEEDELPGQSHMLPMEGVSQRNREQVEVSSFRLHILESGLKIV